MRVNEAVREGLYEITIRTYTGRKETGREQGGQDGTRGVRLLSVVSRLGSPWL